MSFEICHFQGIETKFAGSCCNDLVISDSAGTSIISGHFDKKIRCWDTRMSDSNKREILVQGKVTSLDMGRGKHLYFVLKFGVSSSFVKRSITKFFKERRIY